MYEPRYGVSLSLSYRFEIASSMVFAWFHNLADAELFVEHLDRLCSVWDLNDGVQIHV